MDCAAYHELILADLDGALAAHETADVAQHLVECAACRKARALEAEFGLLLRQPARIVPTPDPVRERVLAALADEVRPRPLRRLASVAIAVARRCWPWQRW